MSIRLALELPDEIRAVAAISASLPTPENLDCHPSGHPVSVLVMNGTADPINPYKGGKVSIFGFGDRGTVLSSEDTARYFVALDGISTLPTTERVYRGDASSWVERSTWGAPDGLEVCLTPFAVAPTASRRVTRLRVRWVLPARPLTVLPRFGASSSDSLGRCALQVRDPRIGRPSRTTLAWGLTSIFNRTRGRPKMTRSRNLFRTPVGDILAEQSQRTHCPACRGPTGSCLAEQSKANGQ